MANNYFQKGELNDSQSGSVRHPKIHISLKCNELSKWNDEQHLVPSSVMCFHHGPESMPGTHAEPGACRSHCLPPIFIFISSMEQ